MKDNKRMCPDCNSLLVANDMSCDCGWKDVQGGETHGSDDRCQYRFNGRQCPLTGTVAARFGSKWYCSEHYQSDGDTKLSEEILKAAERASAVYKSIDWQRKAFPEDFKISKAKKNFVKAKEN